MADTTSSDLPVSSSQSATTQLPPNTDPGPDAGSSDPTDGRKKHEWKSSYPLEAKKQIRMECYYIVLLLGVSILMIFATWLNIIAYYISHHVCLTSASAQVFRKYSFYCFSGLLGGTVYGMKYLYRVVARGYWHEDRKAWRYMSPFIALAISFAFGALIDGKFITINNEMRASSIIGIGFLVGYFADRAIGKLHDIADVVFGQPGSKPNK